jgi:quinol-cytochrome oxidoreductase complex cytochrome b subunit
MSIKQAQPVGESPVPKGKSLVHEIGEQVYRAVFRSPPVPETELERSKSVADNFFFHIHSAKVHERSLKFKTTLGLGLITLYTFVILILTGVMLMFYYVPVPEAAYDRMLDLRGTVFLGTFLRNLHRWSAHSMVAFAFLHMCRVFLTGAHKAPREFNWLVGLALLLLTAVSSFTGYLLPWDQLAYWAIVVGTTIATYAPGGNELRFFLLGDNVVGAEALLRFYVLHCVVLPIVLTTLIGLHFWRIRKDGGLARPKSEPTAEEER